jgi:2-oxoglutarate dehydrogenase complex dehydrogenase (E1) component-like enzyme
MRMEQLYPLDRRRSVDVLSPYADGTDLVWAQEEPWNMGGWFFIRARVPEIIGAPQAAALHRAAREREPGDRFERGAQDSSRSMLDGRSLRGLSAALA